MRVWTIKEGHPFTCQVKLQHGLHQALSSQQGGCGGGEEGEDQGLGGGGRRWRGEGQGGGLGGQQVMGQTSAVGGAQLALALGWEGDVHAVPVHITWRPRTPTAWLLSSARLSRRMALRLAPPRLVRG